MSDIIGKIKMLAHGISRVIYPEICPLCGDVVDYKSGFCCKECINKLLPITEPTCLKCGKEVQGEETECCTDCAGMVRSYIKGFPALNYNEDMAKCLSAFKYNNMRCYAPFLADLIVRYKGRELLMVAPDVIVPVPIHSSRLKTRGYNQAQLLAKELGERLNIPVDDELIQRNAKTTPQKELSSREREENLKMAFISTEKIVKYKCALIVDDIYTSGATVEACTTVLHHIGIQDVYYTSVCAGKGY